ncbi:ADP-ribosylglycohydrolase family protein [Portibacter lacus]|uniref:ADP-ribosylglycohydrolase n=1 Tax=Portibacter lacus TaxID=1099794 RepID=A0AA37WF67_9BACT|nr:ADP-ribosylglycohydrolase family protein [Portibacter lacus]GLR18553.1 hypothetical protein GCM10007940_31690 [Portibacter lacus]
MKKAEINIPVPNPTSYDMANTPLTEDVFYDKILGALVGSAIGDAMGAPTEMWDRNDIQAKFGFVNGLTPVIREKSPEGTWQHNMISGSTTDDTRWKMLVGQYLIENKGEMSPDSFAKFIVTYYQSLLKGLSNKEVLNSTDVLEDEMEKVDWIKEWARVALVYGKDEVEYAAAQNRFYGGEMACGGLLYSPMFGLTATSSEKAYRTAFEHSFFDIGYARDLSALASVMTNLALYHESIDTILTETFKVDPFKYKESRLIGRLSYNMAMEAKGIVQAPIEVEQDQIFDTPPLNFKGSPEDWYRLNNIYDRLSSTQRSIAFHAGEIWQILIAGLTYGDGDILKTMQFIVNYGRDNDTVAAIAGMILGAKVGFTGLPVEIRDEVVRVSKDVMGIDLKELAKKLVKN